MYQGSCLCGGVQLSITGKISDIIHCHCSLCRKSTGSAFATNGFVNLEDFTITQGQALLKSFELRSGRKRYFCSHCAAPVYSANAADPTRIRLRLGILDSDIAERPISHNFVTSKANWDSLGIDLPQYEAHEPGRK
ncbi:GFA family protein [Photobacterium galatheae]|uniref:Aldehyde-activating protein n=1 Tax=Photobacterium galatheae TaxID=1654360 RepID=A0A066RL11_9GAMM|nr:GFA family protein [Photobacterium galatheae]KDM89791.1 aldehyde-activating protein [Photobacterium galatheae]MCM0151442.1 GFA family protein [Photobacterium galatheae]